MNIKRNLVCVVLALVPAMQARAGRPMTGSELLEHCTAFELGERESSTLDDPVTAAGYAICLGYIGGFVDAGSVQASFASKGNGTRLWCAPDGGVTNGQFASVILRYLRDNPGSLNDYAGPLVYQSLKRKFPCAPTKPATKGAK